MTIRPDSAASARRAPGRRPRFLRAMLALLALAFAGTAPLAAQTLQLADGQVLLAKVEDVSAEGLRVQRLDNGGMLELRWEHLTADCAQRTKVANGLAGDDQSELTTSAMEVRYTQNGALRTLIGRIVEGGGVETLLLQQKGVIYRIPRAEAMVRAVEVPVSQVFTPDEFYSQRLGEIAPGDSSDKHRQLAEDLVRVRDYPRALEHLTRAKELANSRAPEQIDALTERVKLYVAARKEREVLDQIQIARARATPREFERGLELIAQFEKDYPQSRLKSDFDSEKNRFAAARTRYFSQQVADTWRRAIGIVADKKMQEPGVDLAMAREYAESKMTDDIVALVAQRLKLTAEETKQMFSVRDKYPVGRRTEHFSYGIGSWLLGEAAILKGTKQESGGKEPTDPVADRQLEKLKKALEKMREASRAQGKGQGQGGDREQSPDEFWAASERSDRANWLRAYYAENGGQLKITTAFTQPCFNCQGIGTTSEMGPNNKVIKVKCYLCHGTKALRSFKAY